MLPPLSDKVRRRDTKRKTGEHCHRLPLSDSPAIPSTMSRRAPSESPLDLAIRSCVKFKVNIPSPSDFSTFSACDLRA